MVQCPSQFETDTRQTSIHASTRNREKSPACLPAAFPLQTLDCRGNPDNAPSPTTIRVRVPLRSFSKSTIADRRQHDTGRAAGRVVPGDLSHTSRPQGGRTARHIRDTATYNITAQRKPPILHVLNGWCDSTNSLAAQSVEETLHALLHPAAIFGAALSLPPPPPPLPRLPSPHRPPPPPFR